MGTHKGCVNARVDSPHECGPKLTGKQVMVYFAYLVNSKRNPDVDEGYRYVYKKDYTKKQLGEEYGISQPTIRAAEKRLIEIGYMEIDDKNRVIRLLDGKPFTWIPIKAIKVLLEAAKGTERYGDLLRLYAVLYHFKEEPQEFNARTWVRAFGMNEEYLENYIHIHLMFFMLKLFGLIDYTEGWQRSHNGKKYRVYKDVVIIPANKIEAIDDREAEVDKKVEEYTKVLRSLSDGELDSETNDDQEG